MVFLPIVSLIENRYQNLRCNNNEPHPFRWLFTYWTTSRKPQVGGAWLKRRRPPQILSGNLSAQILFNRKWIYTLLFFVICWTCFQLLNFSSSTTEIFRNDCSFSNQTVKHFQTETRKFRQYVGSMSVDVVSLSKAYNIGASITPTDLYCGNGSKLQVSSAYYIFIFEGSVEVTRTYLKSIIWMTSTVFFLAVIVALHQDAQIGPFSLERSHFYLSKTNFYQKRLFCTSSFSPALSSINSVLLSFKTRAVLS